MFDFKFYLYDIEDPLATPIAVAVVTDVEVTDGLFVLEIDFGQSWDGSDRWMQICVQETGAGGDMTCLAQLHKLTHVPTSVYSVNSGLLNNLQSTDFVRSTCRICIGWADSNGGSPTEQQCHDLSRNGIDTSNRLEFDGDVDDNDRLWLWMECP
ncbi:MAG: hypothetical protein GY842_09950 [bacterium]|nr:hypothetical protein [bacterium]